MIGRKMSAGLLVACLLLVAMPQEAAPQTPAVDVAGTWKISVQYVYGAAEHEFSLQQEGEKVTGTYKTQMGTTWPVEGTIKGDTIELRTRIKHEASTFGYIYTGKVSGPTMEGTVDLGEFWSAKWTAARSN